MSFFPAVIAFLKSPEEILGYVDPYLDQAKPHFDKMKPHLEKIPYFDQFTFTPINSLLIAVFIIYAAHMLQASCAILSGTFSAINPRGQATKSEPGFFERLAKFFKNAHENSLEGFIFYAVGVVLCTIKPVDEGLFQRICVLYIVTRILYVLIYGLHILPGLKYPISLVRSSIWFTNTLLACTLIKLAAISKSE
mmetsp:Transcript_10969/g.15250  ORF Transcript_10969/g.15250 Transcript_10969/m.15250 type:complete len:194 (-) Transcript_10969:138-719(-)|eukprot:CAMPEP_0184497302 /NCGR_PEP_ID=MMETSP0113_2-20130426/36139_1 /TAXON_ID=91329 /ORGANISM="Norrisiella sphaerica, Strain BC52" /LENGTH=193 /DNA_ID=CAMNT_0026884335 /DNA_START=66 /DNA_END=647 /DNA_ORIENTATION=+